MKVEKGEPDHAELSASGAYRWIACPASIKASRGIENRTSEAAEEGTAAHELAERCLQSGKNISTFIGEKINGFYVDAEMAEFVGVYVDYCRSIQTSRSFVETRVDFSMWVPDGFGTADFVAICYRGGEAHVVDLKYGRGLVEADNPQLKCYALGVFNKYGFDAQIDTIHMTIVQPRLYHFDTHTMRVSDLLKFGKNILKPAALAALKDDAEFHPQESACRFCLASETCKPLAQHALSQLELDFNDLNGAFPDADKITSEDVARLLPHMPLVKSWCDKISQKAQSLLTEGHAIEGYKLVRSKTNRRWADEDAALQLMQKLTNEPVYTAKTISPTQALKILGDENEELNELITKPEGKPTLVPESDKRSAINVSEGFDVIEK